MLTLTVTFNGMDKIKNYKEKCSADCSAWADKLHQNTASPEYHYILS